MSQDLPAGHTLDAFHRGRFHLVQPQRGHRAGMDGLVLAASVPDGFSGQVTDLGAGSGVAGLAVLSHCPHARALLVERDPDMALAARLTIGHPANRALAGRVRVVETDVELAGKARTDAGLLDRSADFVLMNPPFNAADDRASNDMLRRDAHVLRDGLLAAWVRTAAAIAAPGAGIAIIARPASLPELLNLLDGRAGGVEIVPIHPRASEPAIRVLLRGWKGSRAPLQLLPPLVLHEGPSNQLTGRADAIINGRMGLIET